MSQPLTERDLMTVSLQWEGHQPVVPPKIVRNAPRPSAELVATFKDAFIPDLSDAVGALYTMDSSIRPLYHSATRVIGVALTVKVPRADNSTIHRAMRMAQNGDVLIVDARGDTESCGSGAGSLMPAISRGLAGIIIDGGWRDVSELRAIGFPIYGESVSAFSPPKRRPGEINVPVCCGGVIVHPGDIIVCDEEGSIVIPQAYAELVANEVKEYRLKESVDAWDLDRIRNNQVKRDEYFEAIFAARGGVYVD